MSLPRYAIYYTPPPSSRLARFGAGVLGYECHDGADVPHVKVGGIDSAVLALMTVEPRRYGFHATLKAPFHLGDASEAALTDACGAFAARYAPVPVGRLMVATIASFVALVPAEPNQRISQFAATCVEAFDRFRAPPSPADRERRLASGLTPRQVELMDRWGYPYVFEQFRFHMTLTGSLSHDQITWITPLLSGAFQGLASDIVELDAISVMRQDDHDGRFRVVARCRLKGQRS
jgi:putative phosphonate metabolism protein